MQQQKAQTYLRIYLLALAVVLCPAKHAQAQKQGQERIDSMIAAVPGMKADTAKVSLLSAISHQYSPRNPDTGLKYALEALELSRKLHWENGIAFAYNALGISEVYKTDYQKAIEYWDKALKIFKEQNNKRGILGIVGNLGTIYAYQSDYPRALENNFLALKYAEELADEPSVALNLSNIGATYEYMKDYDKALKYDLQALKKRQELYDSISIALILGNIGNLYTDQKKYDEALKYQEQALAYDQRSGTPESISRDLLNIGQIYMNIRDFDKALEFYFRSLELSEHVAFRIAESEVLRAIGEVYIKMARDAAAIHLVHPAAMIPGTKYSMPAGKAALLHAAIGYLKRSIAIDTTINNLNNLQHSYELLSIAQKESGYFKDALVSKDKYISIKDSIFSLESKLKVTNLETKRELDLKDKQIEIDRLEVAKKRNERLFFIAGIALLLVVLGIVIRNIRLSAAKELSENKLQAFQARMNPHFIFNSLNSIQSLVLNNETISSIKYLSEFSKLMRQILDSSAKSKVLLQTELRMLGSYIELEQLRFDRFSYEIKVAPGIAAEGIEVPAMIIQPFVENAIIHGILPKDDAGILSVSFERDEDFIICTIDDNGIGRKRSAELNKSRSKEHESQGISIASNRLALLGGKRKMEKAVTYIDKEENGIATGTRVILRIPVL